PDRNPSPGTGCRTMTDTRTRECPAKVNLFLRVLAREADGFHGIETLFCRIGLSDTLQVTRTDAGIALSVDGAEFGAPEDNLAWRAADAVLAATGRHFGVAMHIVKRVPVGGGLGGGSSDAAGALLAVNQLANNAVPKAELLHLAGRLGADVPFFMLEAGCALAWGHGHRMLRLPPLPPMPVLLLVPGVAVSTPEAYRWIDEIRQSGGPRGSVALDLDVLHNWSDVARLAGNDFEAAVFGRYPAIRAGFEALARTSPMLCRMSGSGSALFAVYRNERDRDDAAMQLGSKYGSVIQSQTL
ncbi:MAG: 4-(cytidine 5'-diphospho)-2-C-methyl-D-erythritol kinase, partial [Gemmatimonadales bacterium]